MPSVLFVLFALITIVGALGVVWNRNPVSSAFSMIGCFLGVAALFIGLNAYFIGTIQILVYTGAIMVLFLFIIMLLDLKIEERKTFPIGTVAGGIGVSVLLSLVLARVILQVPDGDLPFPELAATESKSDVHSMGKMIFSQFHLPLQIVGVLLLVATVGVVVLSKKELTE
ncbi:MAG: NADH-quinone oxidoreductase subunit J [Verrucomicrobiota bacterium]